MGAAAVAGVAGGATLSAPALAQGFRRLKLASAWSRDLPIFFDVAQRFADRITTVSDGRIRVEHFASNELVSPGDLLEATAEGAIDAYHAFDYFWSDRDPVAHLFSSVPYGMTIHEHMAWLAHSGQEHWDAWGQRYGIKPMLAGAMGFPSGLWLSEAGLEAAGASDGAAIIRRFEGLNVRAAGLGGQLLAALGANVVQMPFSQLAPALKDGRLDAVAGFVPLLDNWIGLDEAAGALAGPCFWNPMQSMTLGLNQRVWHEMTAAERGLVELAAAGVTHETLQRLSSRDNGLRAQWHAANSHLRVQFDREILVKAGTHAGKLVEEIADFDAAAAASVDAYIMARHQGHIAMHQGNLSFQEARTLPFQFARPSDVRAEIEAEAAAKRAEAEEAERARQAAQKAAEEARAAAEEAKRQAAEQARLAAQQRQQQQQQQQAAQAAARRSAQAARQGVAVDGSVAGGLDSPY